MLYECFCCFNTHRSMRCSDLEFGSLIMILKTISRAPFPYIATQNVCASCVERHRTSKMHKDSLISYIIWTRRRSLESIIMQLQLPMYQWHFGQFHGKVTWLKPIGWLKSFAFVSWFCVNLTETSYIMNAHESQFQQQWFNIFINILHSFLRHMRCSLSLSLYVCVSLWMFQKITKNRRKLRNIRCDSA